MENVFPPFRFQAPPTVEITPWEAKKALVPCTSGRRQGFTPLVKPAVVLRSTSPHHSCNNQVAESVYDPSFNPSPLSMLLNHCNEMQSTAKSLSKQNVKRTRNRSASDATAIAAIGFVFNNQSSDDLQVFCTKLGGRKVLDFRVQSRCTATKAVVGAIPRSSICPLNGIEIVYFDMETRMLDPRFTFPIKAPMDEALKEHVSIAFSCNSISDEVYEVYPVDHDGFLIYGQDLSRSEPLIVDTGPSSLYIVLCRSSVTGIALAIDPCIATSKVRYSIVVDDTAPSISFMAQAIENTIQQGNVHRNHPPTQNILVSFLPSRHS
ncbi:hypothetical protein THRCLA_09192 [Thraustotheca clavata]|uniref:Uncharacterized protein n=1 Tax=Thraustotheca clavata TaxID=74557 RepID=A0A1V9YYU5_9STRA|nr:hypothetical protein THRCLA_09192 [Thraustotheca clavata]